MTRLCDHCGDPLPKGATLRRVYCSDRCRKAADRAEKAQNLADTGADGPVTSALIAAVDFDDLVGVDATRAELALAMARVVDKTGSHLAAAQLRGLLDEIEQSTADAGWSAVDVSLPPMPGVSAND